MKGQQRSKTPSWSQRSLLSDSMRAEARLDSAVFQLTPTRTRCDLVIIANGITEKIASGLFNPFLAHLKVAQEQIAKGGYSITLEPDRETDTSWFTKGTIERFVRFVSTPEVLERVTTIEYEILQIDNAIAIQGNYMSTAGIQLILEHLVPELELRPLYTWQVEDRETKLLGSNDGYKSTIDPEAEKAIILYKPGLQPQAPESNGSTTQEQNSKVQLLKVLDSRKKVLQKEQGMAFARAVAAGFNMDYFADLISFAEAFGASRSKDACLRFMELWKKKHETGQWVEVEAADAISFRSDFLPLNASGIILTADMKQKEHGEAWHAPDADAAVDANGKADKQAPSDPKVQMSPQEFQHPSYSQWPMHPPTGPLFPPYPMQGLPYYQNYPGGVSYFHPPYPSMEDPRFNTSHKKKSRRHAMGNSVAESEGWERNSRSQDGTDEDISDYEKVGPHGHESHKKSSRSRKKKSGVVVIKNLNYIASKKHEASESESHSSSYSESEEESESRRSSKREKKQKSSARYSRKEEGHNKASDDTNTYSDEVAFKQETDSGNWQVFQNFLLNSEENARAADQDMLSGEKAPPVKRKQKKTEADPLVPPERDFDYVNEQRMSGFDPVNGQASQTKLASSTDELLIQSQGRHMIGNQLKEIEGGRGEYKKMTSDEFMLYGREEQLSNKSSSDLLVDSANHLPGHKDENFYNVTDESFMLPKRPGLDDHLGSDSRTAIDIDIEFPSALENAQESKPKVQVSYEPDNLLLPERGMENASFSYDPALDFDIYLSAESAVKPETVKEENVSPIFKEEKRLDKEKTSRASKGTLDKRRKDALMKKGTPPRMNPSAEARKRAENMRAFKADLEKVKKEQEEENRRRLEALKLERQKRIAIKNGTTASPSQLTPPQSRAQTATKLSPSSVKGSRFTDPFESSSPRQKVPIKGSLVGSNDSLKAKVSKSNGNTNGLTKSVSSLTETNKESNRLLQEAKAATLKRLSEPKGIYRSSNVKAITSAPSLKRASDESPTKITAIIQLDKSKSANLPELRIKASKTLSETIMKKPATEETLLKVTKKKSPKVSDNLEIRSDGKKSRLSNSEDNLVIEKTVVMLENTVVPATKVQPTEVISKQEDKPHNNVSGSTYVEIHAPPSPVVIDHIENSSDDKLDDHPNSYEGVAEKLSIGITIPQPYQAPYARLSSLEDTTTNLGYAGGVPTAEPGTGTGTVSAETDKVHVAFEDLSLEYQPSESTEKPRNKEIKGFRKLLKFGRKSHSSASGEGNLDTDASSVDDHAGPDAPSNDAHLLKKLISQDDTHAGIATSKASRPFSLLAPFRGKNSEKKLATA